MKEGGILMKPNRIDIRKSRRQGKKYVARFKYPSGKAKKTHFGGKGYEDFTLHKDKNRKKLYLNRHKKNENWNDPTTAGSLSRYILWNKPSLEQSFSDYKKRFNINGTIKPRSYYRNLSGKHFLGSNRTFTKQQAKLLAQQVRMRGINARVIPTTAGHRVYVQRNYNFPLPPSDEVDRKLNDFGPIEGDVQIGNEWWRPKRYDGAQNLKEIQLKSEYGITINDVLDSLANGIYAWDNGEYIGDYLQNEMKLFDSMGNSKWISSDGKLVDLNDLYSLWNSGSGRKLLEEWLESLSNKELAKIYSASNSVNSLTDMSSNLGNMGEIGDLMLGGWVSPSIYYSNRELKEYSTEEIMEIYRRGNDARNKLGNEIQSSIANKPSSGLGFFGGIESTDFFKDVALNEVDVGGMTNELITLPIKTLRIWRSSNKENDGKLIAYHLPKEVVEIASEDIKKYRNGEKVEYPSEMFFLSRLGGMNSAIESEAFSSFGKDDVDVRPPSALDYLLDVGYDIGEEMKEEWVFDALPRELEAFEGNEKDNPVIESLDVGVFNPSTGKLVGFHSPSRKLDNNLGFDTPEEQVASVLSPKYARYYGDELLGGEIIDAVYWRGEKIIDSEDLNELSGWGGFDETELMNPQNVLNQYEDDLYAYIIIGKPDLIPNILTPQEARAFLPKKQLKSAYDADRMESFLAEASLLRGQDEESDAFYDDVIELDNDEFNEKYGYTIEEMLEDMDSAEMFDERMDSAQANVDNTLDWGDLTTESQGASMTDSYDGDIFKYYGQDSGKEALIKLADYDVKEGQFNEQKDRYGSF
jgi:hypothetical protein